MFVIDFKVSDNFSEFSESFALRSANHLSVRRAEVSVWKWKSSDIKRGEGSSVGEANILFRRVE